ncbi:FKBP-type peptidyl-prolyl cis-trans isomerase [Reinekea sp.]|uniref:FKBP-type peptidyl-prolyl cis-trans isomerase n=1 Tax=Reinekea sp. TaxID=1970455 RepID=UPI002A812A0E|nr:FKBP-type peptidyl-prolyl cis-trans isomerase [Reinekea sp.]
MSKIIVAVLILIIASVLVNRYFTTRKSVGVNSVVGQEYLVENLKNVNVQTTESGLQYEVLVQGDGSVQPKATDKVTVHYHGTLIDGTVFDSSVERGETISFGLNQVIKGWTEGVQLMVVGDKTRFYIPSNLGYGNRSAGKIPPGSVLVFEIELFGINE